MAIKANIKRAQPSKLVATATDKITFKEVLWAAVYWFAENVRTLLGMNPKREDKPGRIRRAFQFASRRIIMVVVVATAIGLTIISVIIWLTFRNRKEVKVGKFLYGKEVFREDGGEVQ